MEPSPEQGSPHSQGGGSPAAGVVMQEKEGIPSEPLVSVIILNYKRREALKRTLDSVLEQGYPLKEIIVVDNHSEQDLSGVVTNRGAGIKLIELPVNLGPGAGRNAGIREARGEIIVTLDNDVYFSSPFELARAVNKLEERRDVHALTFQICEAGTGKLRIREWCHPRNWEEFGQSEFETYFLAEGASAYRRKVFEVAGLYYEPFFIGHEGWDLALRFLDCGFRILYSPDVRVEHLMSAETRMPRRNYYFYTRNYIWIAYKDYEALAGLKFLMPKLAMMCYLSLRARALGPFCKGLWGGLVGLRRLHSDRTPIRNTTIRYLATLDKNRPGMFIRLARHRAAPQI